MIICGYKQCLFVPYQYSANTPYFKALLSLTLGQSNGNAIDYANLKASYSTACENVLDKYWRLMDLMDLILSASTKKLNKAAKR